MADAKENMGLEHITEVDELADLAGIKPPRETPRTSMAAQETKPTPYADLRALAGLIRKTSTPLRRHPLGVGSAQSTGKEQSQTPLPQPWTTPKVRRPLQQIGPGGSKSTTPHTVRALQQRRATPGQDRRKSGRIQRETPRDALRNLSKILAGRSQPIRPSLQSAPTPSSTLKHRKEDDFEDELSPEQPQFTIAVDEDEEGRKQGEDESSPLDHPKLSMPLEEEEQTIKSVEKARRESLRDEQQRFWQRHSGNLSAGEDMEGSMESKIDIMNETNGDDRQWQDVKDNTSVFQEHRGSGADLRQAIRESSQQRAQMESESPEQFPQTAEFSPFVLDIPELVPQDLYEQSPTYEDLLAEDIQQFGSPLPLVGTRQPQLQKPSLQRVAQKSAFKAKAKRRIPRALKVSRHGTSYASLPAGIVKSISTAFARSIGKKTACLSKDSMNAILHASDRFFEQLGGDLAAASSHAGRKAIDESDVLAVMKRQRQISARASAFSIAARYLPSETIDEMRIPFPRPDRLRKKEHCLKSISEEPE